MAGLNRRVLVLALVTITYAVAARAGLEMAFIHASATAVWPPTGIALAAMLVLGYDVWPAIFLGAFVANLLTFGTVETSLGIAIGNTLEAVTGAMLVSRFAGGHRVMDRTRGIVLLAILAGMVSTLISPTIGATSLAVGGYVPWSGFDATWLTWWLGACAGDLIAAPALLLWYANPRVRWTRRQALEAAGLIGCLALVGLALFGGALPRRVTQYPLEIVLLPPLFWAAYRFGPRESASVILVLSAFAIRGTLHGYGPFAGRSPNTSLMLLQLFLATSSLMGLVFASVVAERRLAEDRLHRLAITDALTGLANYREFMRVLEGEIARSSRTGRVFSVLFFDVDGLKQINDRSGHLAGSRAIQRVANALSASCRSIDTAARFGGDEFAMVLPETDEWKAREVLARVRSTLATEWNDVTVTVSAGVASYPRDGSTTEAILGSADRHLYDAKTIEARAAHRTAVPSIGGTT
jgi:diguanylate cyclase (GGDEF)-like protein